MKYWDKNFLFHLLLQDVQCGAKSKLKIRAKRFAFPFRGEFAFLFDHFFLYSIFCGVTCEMVCAAPCQGLKNLLNRHSLYQFRHVRSKQQNGENYCTSKVEPMNRTALRGDKTGAGLGLIPGVSGHGWQAGRM